MMETKKHFIAIHNETGERIEFGVEDISSITFGDDSYLYIGDDYYKPPTKHHNLKARWGGRDPVPGFSKEDYDMEQVGDMRSWLKDHTLYYLHQGKYYNYETQEEMG